LQDPGPSKVGSVTQSGELDHCGLTADHSDLEIARSRRSIGGDGIGEDRHDAVERTPTAVDPDITTAYRLRVADPVLTIRPA
jgi:hypothetical protein